MKVGIINIGYELLQGRVVNTNASYIARKVTLLGHDVAVIMCVGDNYNDIARALDIAFKIFDCDIVITTGGLGPTPDDITLEAIAKYLGRELVLDEQALKMIEEKYRSRGETLTDERKKMAFLPRGAIPIPNPVGTAPGAWIEANVHGKNIVIVALPGVPREMEMMFEQFVEPRLGINRVVAEGELLVDGVMESTLAPIIKQSMKMFGFAYIKSHPEGRELENPRVRIYVATYDSDPSRAVELCNEVLNSLSKEIESSLGVKPSLAKACSSQRAS